MIDREDKPVIDFNKNEYSNLNSVVLPKLYCKRADGKIHEWTIEINGNKHRTISGLIDGEKIITNWTITSPKNEGKSNCTTSEQQALFEAKSEWKKKKDKKYFESIEEATCINVFQPMLAEKWNEYRSKVSFPLFCQPKLDGMRCITDQNGMNSRNGKKIHSAPHIIDCMSEIFKKYQDIKLDGELYCDKLKNDFNSIISLVKKTKPTNKDLIESKSIIQYWVYDIPSCNEKFSERTKALKSILEEYPNDYLVFVPTFIVENEKELDDLYYKWLKDGFEGQMVRQDSSYLCKRTNNLLKRKEFLEEEFEIIEIVEGNGNRRGMAASIRVKKQDGTIFDSNIKGGNKFYEKLLNEKENIIGKLATIRFQNFTPDGIPRFPFVYTIRDYE